MEDNTTRGSTANKKEQNNQIKTRNAEQNRKNIFNRRKLNEQSPRKAVRNANHHEQTHENNQENVHRNL